MFVKEKSYIFAPFPCMNEPNSFFSVNADKYAKSKSHASGEDLKKLIDMLQLKTDDICLDLAAGTGFTSMEMAKLSSIVVAYDLTPKMLEEARKLAIKGNIKNIVFLEGKVEQLPFLDESFNVVVTRRAAHHFNNKNEFLKEAYRVLKKGGTLGIADMVTPATDNSESFNRLEQIRDSTHVKAEKVEQWKKLVYGAGFEELNMVESMEEFPYEKWIYPVDKDGQISIKAMEFLSSLSKSEASNIGYDKDKMILKKHRLILVAKKPQI
jgi:ubiquinone/menaquinone biosynthesis C-methylase UbiE